MKNVVFTLFLLCFTGISFSQNSFVVLDENNVPAKGADVFYHKKRIGITGPEGKFLMPQVPAGDTIVFNFGELTTFYVIQEARSGKGLTQTIHFSSSLEEITIKAEDGGWDMVPPPAELEQPIENEIYTAVEQPAEFPGGVQALLAWIKKNMQYPQTALENGLQGKCYVKLVVEKDGSITNIDVLRGVPDCPDCNKEAIRLMKSMPKWKPAMNNGAPVRSYFTLPISFKID